ncbi:hypothetical protein E2C01_075113 [Portunus trituberculatus]|uniref:Uncharacterized protein n=1 Tax=Portunus trituberculatus TaxID=210409 RepID=A0A5B7IE43_PORTR|nr:hypothetical protein [Portunus trituberculatus]
MTTPQHNHRCPVTLTASIPDYPWHCRYRSSIFYHFDLSFLDVSARSSLPYHNGASATQAGLGADVAI